MEKVFRDLCLLMFIVILVLPVEAVPNELYEFGNFTERSGLNKTENASINYFDSGSGLICTAAGKTSDYEEIISTDDLVEDINFLTNDHDSELSPVWTADGNFILYTVKRDGSDNFESYRMNADGSGIERTGIGEGNLTGFSDINPSGTELILTKSIHSQLGLYLAKLENETVNSVTDDPQVSESWGAWCRLGRKIAYTQESPGMPSQLWIVDQDGSKKTRLGTSENIGVGKDWCPLGLRVVYSAKDQKEESDLWVIDFYGTNQIQLTNASYNEWSPSFSPDGKWIAYVSDEGGSPDIWLRDIEGNYRSRLTNHTGRIDSVPKWSPDGSKIIFAGCSPGNNSNIDLTGAEVINDLNSNSSDINDSTINSSNINDSNIDTTNGSNINLTNGPDTSLTNGLNISLINDSGIDSINSSYTGLMDDSGTDLTSGTDPSNSSSTTCNGSDIVIIKLLSAPYISPYPKITGAKVYPIEGVSQEGNITISVTAVNEGGNASEG
jgi:TolB protein